MFKIGLFPLNLIIFPNSYYPLHIFENRYKVLIKDILEGEKKFGINYVSKAKMFEIGTVVEVAEILKKYENGSIDIVIKGDSRFILDNLIEGVKPYFIGHCSEYNDTDNSYNIFELSELVDIYNEIVSSVFNLKSEVVSHKDFKDVSPSFFIAQKSGLEFSQKQELLELQSEDLRIKYLLKQLKNLLPQIKNVESIKKIIQSDGYINPQKFDI